MMTIIWKGKPTTHAARLVTRVWFSETGYRMFYCVDGDNHVFNAPTRTVAHVCSEAMFEQFQQRETAQGV